MLVYSWNVLNPKYAEKTWGGVPEAKELGEKDQARTAYRQKAILEVVRGWLKSGPTVVCLQEVWPALREALEREYGERCATGSLGNRATGSLGPTRATGSLGNRATTQEVTLVAGCRIVRSRTLAYALVCDVEVGGRHATKSLGPTRATKSLGPTRATKSLGRLAHVEVANVHFYWRWADLREAARALRPRGAQIVAGDFNKEWEELGDMLRGRRGTRLGATAMNPSRNELGGIDHVLATKHFNKPKGRIVEKAAGYTLRYGFSEIKKLRTPWLEARPMKDVSDHSAIQARLTFSNQTRKHFSLGIVNDGIEDRGGF